MYRPRASHSKPLTSEESSARSPGSLLAAARATSSPKSCGTGLKSEGSGSVRLGSEVKTGLSFAAAFFSCASFVRRSAVIRSARLAAGSSRL